MKTHRISFDQARKLNLLGPEQYRNLGYDRPTHLRIRHFSQDAKVGAYRTIKEERRRGSRCPNDGPHMPMTQTRSGLTISGSDRQAHNTDNHPIKDYSSLVFADQQTRLRSGK